MKRWKKIVGGVLIVFVVGGAGTAWHFKNEIQAANYYLRYSAEERENLEQDNEKALANVLEKANLPVDLFSDPSLTPEEIAQKLDTMQQEQPTNETDTTVVADEANQAAANSSNGQDTQTYDAELAAMVGEIYGLRSSFVGELNGLLQQAKAEYTALSPEERKKQQAAIASKYVGMAGGLESSCDAQMEDILGRMQKHLKETGGDVSMIKEVRKVYENEKALKKSYYMSLL